MLCVLQISECASGAKVEALRAELLALQLEEPHLHAVVFTETDIMVERIRDMTKTHLKDFSLYELNPKMSAGARHDRILTFQKAEKKPKLFVMSYKIAACGVTLTAATRVFLMEPVLDPSTEHQAAGRIHRLGQTREVFVKRFAYRASYEAAVIALHDKIKKGEVTVTDRRMSLRDALAFYESVASVREN